MEWIHSSHLSNDVGCVKGTLAEHYHFHIIVQVYKILHQFVPVYLPHIFMFIFMFSENVTGYVGMSSHRLFLEYEPLMDRKVCFI